MGRSSIRGLQRASDSLKGAERAWEGFRGPHGVSGSLSFSCFFFILSFFFTFLPLVFSPTPFWVRRQGTSPEVPEVPSRSPMMTWHVMRNVTRMPWMTWRKWRQQILFRISSNVFFMVYMFYGRKRLRFNNHGTVIFCLVFMIFWIAFFSSTWYLSIIMVIYEHLRISSI